MTTGTLTIPGRTEIQSDGSTVTVAATTRSVTYTPPVGPPPPPPPPPTGGLYYPAGWSSANTIYDDSFTGAPLNSMWIKGMANGYDGALWRGGGVTGVYSAQGGSFVQEYYDPAQITFGTDGLELTAVPDNNHRFSAFPWKSGGICTGNNYNTNVNKTTRIQALMKMPDMHNGAWPAFWFLDGLSGGTRGEFDAAECGDYDGIHDANMLFDTWDNISNPQNGIVSAPADLTTGFHTYEVETIGSSWKMYFDGVLLNSWNSNTNRGSEIIFTMQMFGNGSWHSVSDAANHPGPYTMKIRQIRIMEK